MKPTSKKKKAGIAALSVSMAALIALSGTFAWQSITQVAVNENAGFTNPGGRLHDDYNGTNKDVYVENFNGPNEGGVPIYARVRLSEYMEFGNDAGVKKGEADRDVTPVIRGTEIDKPSTWQVHTMPLKAEDTLHNTWEWTMGGSKVFMPTFNKNKDSLAADINGTFAGPDGDPETNDDRFEDYKEYTNGQKLTGDAVYDIDDDTDDEGDAAVEGTDIETKKGEEHTAKLTQDAEVISMADWIAKGGQPGKFWVYDADGWAYWAEAIQPGEATGLLLDHVQQKVELTQKWYYAINVEGQFVTVNDFGTEADQTGFYADGNTVSDEALHLLNKIMGNYVTGEDSSLYLKNADNTYQKYDENGKPVADSLYIPGDDGKLGTADDKKVTTIDPADDTYGSKFAANGDKGNSYTAAGPDGIFGTEDDDPQVWGNPTLTARNIGKYTVTVTAANDTTIVDPGKTLQFTAKVLWKGKEVTVTADKAVTWSVSGNTSTNTTISTSGRLTVGSDETRNGTLIISAESQKYGIINTITVTVKNPIELITPGSTTTVKIDDINFYVLAQDTENDRAMLLSKDILEKEAFDSGKSTAWEGSEIQEYLNGEWLEAHDELSKKAVAVPFKTRSTHDGTDFTESADSKVFLLSEADVFGTHNRETAQPDDYTYNGKRLPTPGGSWIANYNGSASNWLLRNPGINTTVTNVLNTGNLSSFNPTVPNGLRPALWVNLES